MKKKSTAPLAMVVTIPPLSSQLIRICFWAGTRRGARQPRASGPREPARRAEGACLAATAVVKEYPAPGGEGGAGRMGWPGRENRPGATCFTTAGAAATRSSESHCAEQPRHERQTRRRGPLLGKDTGRPSVQEFRSCSNAIGQLAPSRCPVPFSGTFLFSCRAQGCRESKASRGTRYS